MNTAISEGHQHKGRNEMWLWGQEQLACCHSWSLVTNRASLHCSPHACVGITSAQERRLGVRATVGVGQEGVFQNPAAGPEESTHRLDD